MRSAESLEQQLRGAILDTYAELLAEDALMHAHICWRMLAYADECMLIFADVC